MSDVVREIDTAIVGRLERVSVVFLDESEPSTLHTVLTFRVSELLFGKLPDGTEQRIDVLRRGGTFVEEKGTRVPERPIESARELVIGAEYFVPLEDGDKFGRELKGQLILVGDRHVTPRRAVGQTGDPQHDVGRRGRREITKATDDAWPAPTAREVLLAAVRETDRRKP